MFTIFYLKMVDSIKFLIFKFLDGKLDGISESLAAEVNLIDSNNIINLYE